MQREHKRRRRQITPQQQHQTLPKKQKVSILYAAFYVVVWETFDHLLDMKDGMSRVPIWNLSFENATHRSFDTDKKYTLENLKTAKGAVQAQLDDADIEEHFNQLQFYQDKIEIAREYNFSVVGTEHEAHLKKVRQNEALAIARPHFSIASVQEPPTKGVIDSFVAANREAGKALTVKAA